MLITTVSLIGIQLGLRLLERGMARSGINTSVPYCPYMARLIFFHQHQAFLNYLDTFLMFPSTRKVAKDHRAADMSLVGREVATIAMVDAAIERYGIVKLSQPLGLKVLMSTLTDISRGMGRCPVSLETFVPAIPIGELEEIDEKADPIMVFEKIINCLPGEVFQDMRTHLDTLRSCTSLQFLGFMTLTGTSESNNS